MKKKGNYLLTILGPTACGKTRLAANVALKIGGEIISADSRQVYRRMNIGTGKDYNDYIIENKIIPYHLIDIVEAGYQYNVFEYQNDFVKAFTDIISRNKFPVLCGGTGLYIEAVTKGFKLIRVPFDHELKERLETLEMKELIEILSSFKKLHNTTEINSKKRLIRAIEIEKYYQDIKMENFIYPELNNIFTGINIDVDKRRGKISGRLKFRLQNGMVEEVRDLLASGISKENLFYYGLEYKFIAKYLTGELDYATMVTQLEISIHQFAKRQMTWFRGMEKRGININWIDESLPLDVKVEKVTQILHANEAI